MSTDPNFDPRDATEIRQLVTLGVRAGAEPLDAWWSELSEEWLTLSLPYHDMMAIDKTHGVIRFPWDVSTDIVERAASWLESVPAVIDVKRYYGSRGDSQ